MISKVRIQNLKSLRDTGFIDIRPITILAGENSSGKSTFLRMFPLLTQSVTKKLRGPISWFDDTLVDFGDYATAKCSNADKDENIVFSFKLELSLDQLYLPYHVRSRISPIITDLPELYVSVHYSEDTKGTFVKRVDIISDLFEIKIIQPERGGSLNIEADSEHINTPADFKWIQGSDFGMLPMFYGLKTHDSYYYINDEILKQILSPVSNLCDKRFRKFSKLFPLYYKWCIDKETYLWNVKKFSDIKSLKKEIENWTIDTPEFCSLYRTILVHKMLEIWPYINSELTKFFMNCDYTAPLRAQAQRYYRNQGLLTSNIDSHGYNLSEFIDSLTKTQRESYRKFVKRLLGIEVLTKNITGHQTINLKENDCEFNLTDVGFGYSQMLPIITKIWSLQEGRRFSSLAYYRQDQVTSLIEQPELHLHPSLQGKLADAFIRAIDVDNSSYNSQFIIETHSSTIINRIGRRIAEGKLSSEKVNVVLFEKKSLQGDTIVKCTQFDSKGRLKQWPIGFFEPEDEDF